MPDSLRVKGEKDLELHKPIMLFGRDITEIPCFRKSLICGICTGAVGGLACFLATSKTLFSTHVAFASIWIGTFAYWFPCRIKYESQCLVMTKINEKIRQRQEEERAKETLENAS